MRCRSLTSVNCKLEGAQNNLLQNAPTKGWQVQECSDGGRGREVVRCDLSPQWFAADSWWEPGTYPMSLHKWVSLCDILIYIQYLNKYREIDTGMKPPHTCAVQWHLGSIPSGFHPRPRQVAHVPSKMEQLKQAMDELDKAMLPAKKVKQPAKKAKTEESWRGPDHYWKFKSTLCDTNKNYHTLLIVTGFFPWKLMGSQWAGPIS